MQLHWRGGVWWHWCPWGSDVTPIRLSHCHLGWLRCSYIVLVTTELTVTLSGHADFALSVCYLYIILLVHMAPEINKFHKTFMLHYFVVIWNVTFIIALVPKHIQPTWINCQRECPVPVVFISIEINYTFCVEAPLVLVSKELGAKDFTLTTNIKYISVNICFNQHY